MAIQKTVLLVDDDVDFLKANEMALGKTYRCQTARSGKECLAALLKTKPDLIVMDVMMEDLCDGLETAKKVKSGKETAGIPIIMLTSVNNSFDYRTQVGDDYFPRDKWLDKPVKPEVLLREVKALIGA